MTTADLERYLAQAARSVFSILVGGSPDVARSLRDLLGASGRNPEVQVVFAQTVPKLHRPFEPLSELIAGLLAGRAGNRLQAQRRYERTLKSLVPESCGSLPDAVKPFFSRMVQYPLYRDPSGLRDYFVGRNVRPWITDDLLGFLTAAAPREDERPVSIVLCVDRLDRADPSALEVLRHLPAKSQGRAISVLASWKSESPQELDSWAGMGWNVLPLSEAREIEDTGGTPDFETEWSRLTRDERKVLAAAASLPGRFDLETVATVAEMAQERVAEILNVLDARRLVLKWHSYGFTLVDGVGSKVHAFLSPEEQAALHTAAAELESERFAKAYHLRKAGTPGYGVAELTALEACWGMSSYLQAETHAKLAFQDETVDAQYDLDLLLGLLYYEARRYEETDECLLRVLDREVDEERRAVLHRLIGYNGIFGIRQFEYGIEHLERVGRYYDSLGRRRDAAWIRNAVAFGLLQSGRAEEAIELEKKNLEEANQLENSDRFLLSILNLNLGRLHRGRSLEEAEDYISRSMMSQRGDLGPFLLLLLYITLGNLYFKEGQDAKAASFFSLCVDLAFEIDLAGFTDRSMPLLKRVFDHVVSPLDASIGLRGELASGLCHFNLALCLLRAGHTSEAIPYRDWACRHLGQWMTEEQRLAMEQALDREQSQSSGPTDQTPTGREGSDSRDNPALEEILVEHRDFLEIHSASDSAERLGRRVSEGHLVATLARSRTGLVRSHVLFDPRSPQVRKRLLKELGRRDQAGGVLALPEAAHFFEGANPEHLEVVQEVSIRPEHIEKLGGIVPVHTRLRFIPDNWTELQTMTRAFSERASVPLVGAISFRQIGEEIATTPVLAAKYFLETSLDYLYLDDLVIQKKLGADAPENLRALRPSFSGRANLPRHIQPGESAVLQGSRPPIKIGPEGVAVLSQCDGTTTVGDLMDFTQARGASPPEVTSFLRSLRHRGVIHFNL